MIKKSNESRMVATWSAMSVMAHVGFLLEAAGFHHVTISLRHHYVELRVYAESVGDSLAAEDICEKNSMATWAISRESFEDHDGSEYYYVSLMNDSLYDGVDD